MSAKHTAGPWHTERDDDGTLVIIDDAREMDPIYVDQSQDECEANASLIAAAPELLDALKKMLPAYREAVKLFDPNTDDAFTVLAHNAIYKAEGKQ